MQDTPQCKGEMFRVNLGLCIYYMGNRLTTMGYLTKYGGGPHQNGQRIRRIS